MNEEFDIDEDHDQNLIQLGVNVTYGKAGREINAAIYNSNERKFFVTEFQDNEHFSNFESLLLQVNPQNSYTKFNLMINLPQLSTEKGNSIILFLKSKYFNIEKMMDIISLADIEYEEKPKESFTTKNLESDLNILLKKPLSNYLKEAQLTKALSSVMCLIISNQLLTDKSNIKQFSLESYSLQNFMKLDLAAINALSIFPKTMGMNITTNDNGTLLGLLDKCKTQIGSRCLKRWIKQPLQNIEEIEKRFDCVESLVNDRQLLNHLQNEFLRKIPDLDKLYAKFYKIHSKKKHNGSLLDCIKVYQVVYSLKGFCEFLSNKMLDESNAIVKHYLNELKNNLNDFEKFEEMIEQSIDMEKAKHGEYLITSSFSPKLSQINKELNKFLAQIESHRKIVEKDLNIDVKVTDSNTHIFLFESNKKEGDDAFRASSKKYKTISIKQRTVAFTTNELTEIVADYVEQKNDYKEEQKQVVGKILEVVSTYYPAMENAASLIAELDCIAAFAHTSANASTPYIRPKINKGGNLIMKDCRHPCLAFMDSERTIPNDCEMFKNKSILHMITGPNMGGKSTYIRQVAIGVLLAHIGCFVPCSSAEIPIVDAIITRVGASDMQLKGISTFMSEMLETSCMLKIGTENSLLIVDELGRGTSTSEGFGISWAVAEYIAKNVKGYCLFATHFHELTIMEGQIPGVKNFYVSAISKDGKLTMQYRVKPGAVDRSYGLFVAEMLKFPREIIENGKQKAKELERFEDQYGEKINDEEDEDDDDDGDIGDVGEMKNKTIIDDEINNARLIDLAKEATSHQKLKVLSILGDSLKNIKNGDGVADKKRKVEELLLMTKKILFKKSRAQAQ